MESTPQHTDLPKPREVSHKLESTSNAKPFQVLRSPKILIECHHALAECESNFVVQSYYQYGCAGHKDRGATVCSNGIKVSRKVVEDRCLAALRDELFAPEAVDLFVKETTRLLAERNRQRGPELERLQRRLAEVQHEITNIMNAIKAGILTSTTKEELERREDEHVRLEEAIKGATAKADKVVTLLPRARELYEALVRDLGRLSQRHVTQAREQVRELVRRFAWCRPSRRTWKQR